MQSLMNKTFQAALPEAPAIRRVIDEHFTADNAKAELDYLRRLESRGFERLTGSGG